MSDSFVFYRSFYDALKEFKASERAKVYDAVFSYIFDGVEPQLSGNCKAAWILIRPQLDANIRRRENGMKGGRPKTNGFENAKTETKPTVSKIDNRTKTESEPNVNVNVNANANTLSNERVTREDQRHKYGRYKNVLLSDDDLAKLKAEFPGDWESRIENLSEGIECKGYRYKNHLAVIRKWARNDAVKSTPAKNSQRDFIQGSMGDDLDVIENLSFRRVKEAT